MRKTAPTTTGNGNGNTGVATTTTTTTTTEAAHGAGGGHGPAARREGGRGVGGRGQGARGPLRPGRGGGRGDLGPEDEGRAGGGALAGGVGWLAVDRFVLFVVFCLVDAAGAEGRHRTALLPSSKIDQTADADTHTHTHTHTHTRIHTPFNPGTQGMYKEHVAARDPANAVGMFHQVLNDHQQALEWLQVRPSGVRVYIHACTCVSLCVCVSVSVCVCAGAQVAAGACARRPCIHTCRVSLRACVVGVSLGWEWVGAGCCGYFIRVAAVIPPFPPPRRRLARPIHHHLNEPTKPIDSIHVMYLIHSSASQPTNPTTHPKKQHQATSRRVEQSATMVDAAFAGAGGGADAMR